MLKLDFDIVYAANFNFQAADVLLRLPTDGTKMTPLEGYLLVMYINSVNHDKHCYSSDVLKDLLSILMHLNSEQKKVEVPTFIKFIETQGQDVSFRQAAKHIEQSEIEFWLDENDVTKRRVPMDGALKNWYCSKYENAYFIFRTVRR